MRQVNEAIRQRQFGEQTHGTPSRLEQLDAELISRIESSRDNITSRAIAALGWAIAVDAALLDEALRRDAHRVFTAEGIPSDPLENVHFYYPKGVPNDQGKALFNDYVRHRWPIITFSLDPVTDQQNIADSFNLKRDLQLALSFAFATGQIGFSQLNTFRRQIEQSSDTIALNRTVTGFAHGNDIFGFRFTPRFQNPPNQRTNIGVIASQLIGGGPGPDYQIKKSKLEPGMRELTAVLLMPTFLPEMRMNVAGNWFKLNDPEHLVFHTKRLMEQGRQVQELRQAVVDACSAQRYRGCRPQGSPVQARSARGDAADAVEGDPAPVREQRQRIRPVLGRFHGTGPRADWLLGGRRDPGPCCLERPQPSTRNRRDHGCRDDDPGRHVHKQISPATRRRVRPRRCRGPRRASRTFSSSASTSACWTPG